MAKLSFDNSSSEVKHFKVDSHIYYTDKSIKPVSSYDWDKSDNISLPNISNVS